MIDSLSTLKRDYSMNDITTFDVEVVTDHEPHVFVVELFKYVDIEAEVEDIDGIQQMRTNSFAITVFDQAHDTISAELGIEPNVFIQFRPKQNLQTDVIAIKHLLEAINHWLKIIDNDFALVYNGETVMIYRKQKQIYVNVASRGWTEARLSIINVPYEEVSMPALDETTD